MLAARKIDEVFRVVYEGTDEPALVAPTLPLDKRFKVGLDLTRAAKLEARHVLLQRKATDPAGCASKREALRLIELCTEAKVEVLPCPQSA